MSPRSGIAPSFGSRLGEILAGAEAAAGAGEQDGANRVVRGDAVERVAKLARHRPREAVEDVGPIQRDRGHAVGGLEQDVGSCPALVLGDGDGSSTAGR